MSDDPKLPTRKWGFADVFFATLTVLFLSSISYKLGKIEEAISRGTSFALCTKLTELGGEHPACDRLLGKDQSQ